MEDQEKLEEKQMAELLRSLENAIASYVEVLEKRGEPLPQIEADDIRFSPDAEALGRADFIMGVVSWLFAGGIAIALLCGVGAIASMLYFVL